ncbi:MAG TPA: hypothetical protein VFC44_06710 [Candidatus Saccharimonadales bacterium]|nr:hypothetical protein [Candidatus Saccharimonadales bacterium]
MSMSKSQNETCKLQAVFTGGPMDGQKWWIDRPDKRLAHCTEFPALGGQMMYSVKALYQLKSEGSPVQYEFLVLPPPN